VSALSTYVAGSCRVDGEQPDGVVWPLPPEVDLSLRMLGQLLTSSLYGALMTDFITGRLPQSALPQLQFPSGKLLAFHDAAFGLVSKRCVHGIQEFSPSIVYYSQHD